MTVSECNNICLCGKWENAPAASAYLSVMVWHIEETEVTLLLTSQSHINFSYLRQDDLKQLELLYSNYSIKIYLYHVVAGP